MQQKNARLDAHRRHIRTLALVAEAAASRMAASLLLRLQLALCFSLGSAMILGRVTPQDEHGFRAELTIVQNETFWYVGGR